MSGEFKVPKIPARFAWIEDKKIALMNPKNSTSHNMRITYDDDGMQLCGEDIALEPDVKWLACVARDTDCKETQYTAVIVSVDSINGIVKEKVSSYTRDNKKRRVSFYEAALTKDNILGDKYYGLCFFYFLEKYQNLTHNHGIHIDGLLMRRAHCDMLAMAEMEAKAAQKMEQEKEERLIAQRKARYERRKNAIAKRSADSEMV